MTEMRLHATHRASRHLWFSSVESCSLAVVRQRADGVWRSLWIDWWKLVSTWTQTDRRRRWVVCSAVYAAVGRRVHCALDQRWPARRHCRPLRQVQRTSHSLPSRLLWLVRVTCSQPPIMSHTSQLCVWTDSSCQRMAEMEPSLRVNSRPIGQLGWVTHWSVWRLDLWCCVVWNSWQRHYYQTETGRVGLSVQRQPGLFTGQTFRPGSYLVRTELSPCFDTLCLVK